MGREAGLKPGISTCYRRCVGGGDDGDGKDDGDDNTNNSDEDDHK